MQVWRPGSGGWRSPLADAPLPAAVFGGIEFPNISELAQAGPGCLLGCSSAGSVALWDYTRCGSSPILTPKRRFRVLGRSQRVWLRSHAPDVVTSNQQGGKA